MCEQWIPVAERLPGEPVMKLVTIVLPDGRRVVQYRYYACGRWQHVRTDGFRVVAWMDLPERPSPYEG
jgi:hypothetical protein